MPESPLPPIDTPDHARRVRRFVYLLLIAIAVGQGLASIMTATVLYSPASWPTNRPPHSPMFSANDRSRWCTVWSLAERGTYQIDEIIEQPGWDTIDKVQFQGHFYSSKPALLPTLVAGLYWVVKRATGLDLLKQTHETVHVLLILLNGLPLWISLGVMAAIVERHARTDYCRVFIVAAAAAGTFLSTFLVTFNNHSVAAASAVWALLPALAIVLSQNARHRNFAFAGFWSAFTACNELPALAFFVGLGAYLWLTNREATLKYYLTAAAVPFAAFLATTWASTGNLLPFYFAFGASPNTPAAMPSYRYLHDGVPSYWMNPSGIDANHESWLSYLFNCTFGHHGVYSLTPVFLLTLAGWYTIRRSQDPAMKRFCQATLALTVVVLGFYLTRTASYNYGGNTSGLRWMFWLTPFWLVAAIPALDAWGDRRGFQWLSAGLLAASVFSAALPHNNPWQAPWLQTLMERWGWVDFRTKIEPFAQPRRCWLGPLPAASDVALQPWVEFGGTQSEGQMHTLRIQSLGRSRPNGEWVRAIHVAQNAGVGASATSPLDFFVAEDAFAAAKFPAVYLRTANPQLSKQRLAAVQLFLQGLPQPAEYRAGSIRYLKTPLRRDAFRCQLATAQVAHRPSDTGPILVCRRTLWLSSEIPFGVLQFEETVLDPRDNSTVFQDRMTAIRSSAVFTPPQTTRQDN